jgi:hypothetical protein
MRKFSGNLSFILALLVFILVVLSVYMYSPLMPVHENFKEGAIFTQKKKGVW